MDHHPCTNTWFFNQCWPHIDLIFVQIYIHQASYLKILNFHLYIGYQISGFKQIIETRLVSTYQNNQSNMSINSYFYFIFGKESPDMHKSQFLQDHIKNQPGQCLGWLSIFFFLNLLLKEFFFYYSYYFHSIHIKQSIHTFTITHCSLIKIYNNTTNGNISIHLPPRFQMQLPNFQHKTIKEGCLGSDFHNFIPLSRVSLVGYHVDDLLVTTFKPNSIFDSMQLFLSKFHSFSKHNFNLTI